MSKEKKREVTKEYTDKYTCFCLILVLLRYQYRALYSHIVLVFC